MDLIVAFISMFLLAFGITALGLGLFSTYFGAGKSRAIGVILALIGIVVLLIFYLMTIDHFGYGWFQDDVSDSALGVIGMLIGIVLSIVVVIGLMVVIKEDEPAVPGTEDWKKDLEVDNSKDDEVIGGIDEPVSENEQESADDEAVDDGPTVTVSAKMDPAPETIEKKEDVSPDPEKDSEDDMSEFLKDKEGKKLVKEDWEKMDEEVNNSPNTDEDKEPPAPEEPVEDNEPELPAPEKSESPDNGADPGQEGAEPEEEPEKKEGE